MIQNGRKPARERRTGGHRKGSSRTVDAGRPAVDGRGAVCGHEREPWTALSLTPVGEEGANGIGIFSSVLSEHVGVVYTVTKIQPASADQRTSAFGLRIEHNECLKLAGPRPLVGGHRLVGWRLFPGVRLSIQSRPKRAISFTKRRSCETALPR